MGRDPIRDPPFTHDHSSDLKGGDQLRPKGIHSVEFVSAHGSVQAAVDAVSSDGTVVVDQDITENSISVGTAGVRITGNGTIDNPNADGTAKTIEVTADGVTIDHISLTNSGLDAANGDRCGFHFLLNAGKCTIHDVDTDGGKGPVKGYYTRNRITDCEFLNYTEHMTISSGSKNWRVLNTNLIGDPSNPSQRGIYMLDNCESHKIIDCYVANASQRGIWMNRGASYCRVENCVVENITDYHAIGVQNDSDSGSDQVGNEIINCTIIDAGSRGIVINGSASYDSIDTVVKGCTVRSGGAQTSRHAIDDNGVDTTISDVDARGTFNHEVITTANPIQRATIVAASNNAGMVVFKTAGSAITDSSVTAEGAGYHIISSGKDDIEVKNCSVKGVSGQRCIQATGADWKIVGCHTEGGDIGINDSGDYALIDGCSSRDGINTNTNTITGTNKTSFGS